MNTYILRLTGPAKQVFLQLAAMARINGQLTMGEIYALQGSL